MSLTALCGSQAWNSCTSASESSASTTGGVPSGWFAASSFCGLRSMRVSLLELSRESGEPAVEASCWEGSEGEELSCADKAICNDAIRSSRLRDRSRCRQDMRVFYPTGGTRLVPKAVRSQWCSSAGWCNLQQLAMRLPQIQ